MARRKRVLVVDDDPQIAEAVRLALDASGYETLVANDGDQGLALAERDRPDLLILDLVMPRKSGFNMLERLRGPTGTTRRLHRMPVIMITATDGSRQQAHAAALGADSFIRKPFEMDKLIGEVDRLLKPAS